MEKKTIGAFLSALRKANGLTQRELAEKLGVSDKTVSRWERDEGLPDLSLIPVLAEIFGVSCDELLRGERASPEAQRSNAIPFTEKTEKQKRRLLALTQTRFYNRSWITAGIAVCGLLAAAIANFGFLRAVAGFFIGMVFYLAAAVCEAIWINSAYLAVSDDLLTRDEIQPFKRSVIRRGECIYILIAFLIGFSVPLLLVPSHNVGLTNGWLLGGLLLGGGAILLAAVALFIIHGFLYRRGRYPLMSGEDIKFRHNRRWKRICALSLCALVLVTFFFHMWFTQIWGPFTIMEGQTFTDYESFVDYMAQDIPYPERFGYSAATEQASEAAPAPADGSSKSETWFDEYGNEITEDEARLWELVDANGEVVQQYYQYNDSVVSVQYTPKDGTVLPITVYTYDDLEQAEQLAVVRHIIFIAVYCIEVGAATLIYFRKRMKA